MELTEEKTLDNRQKELDLCEVIGHILPYD